MKKKQPIKSALSVAASVLLASACSSEDSNNVTNSPETLLGTWVSECRGLKTDGTVVVTTASGSLASAPDPNGVGDISINTRFTFANDGMLTISDEDFVDTANCDPQNSVAVTVISTQPYTLLDDVTARDGLPAVEINYSRSGINVFTLYRIYSSSILFFGGRDASTLENDGTTEALRHDGINHRSEYTRP